MPHETLCDFYEYAKKQGCTESSDVFFRRYENLLRHATGITKKLLLTIKNTFQILTTTNDLPNYFVGRSE